MLLSSPAGKTLLMNLTKLSTCAFYQPRFALFHRSGSRVAPCYHQIRAPGKSLRLALGTFRDSDAEGRGNMPKSSPESAVSG